MKKIIFAAIILMIAISGFSQTPWISNGESNLSVRTKLNNLKAETDTMQLYIDTLLTYNALLPGVTSRLYLGDSTIDGGLQLKGGYYHLSVMRQTGASTWEFMWGDKMPHSFAYYSDNSGYTRTFSVANTFYPISTSGYLTYGEEYYFTHSQDTIQYIGDMKAHCRVDIHVVLEGTNADNIEVQVYNITDGEWLQNTDYVTLAGAGIKRSVSIVAYDSNMDPGDKYVIRLKNIAATNSVTIIRITAQFVVDHSVVSAP